jgi:DNA (cytosine-5)-methyltransferase 1
MGRTRQGRSQKQTQDSISKESSQFSAIDFFCGGGGMSCGLRQAGIHVIAGVDLDADAKETYEFNNKGTVFVQADIKTLDSDYLAKVLNVKKDDDTLIFVGCSPCQFYSIINTDRERSLKSKDLLLDFARFVEYYRPGYVLVENVPGIVTNKNSILPSFLEKLNSLGYTNCAYKVVDLSYYGVPQSRKRFSLIATRLNKENVHLPIADGKRAILKDFIGEQHGFAKVSAGNKDCSPMNHTTAGLSEKTLRRLQKTKHNGGSRLDWADDPELQLKCFEGKDDAFPDTFGRMCWDKPASTITTKFYSISNGRFGHPDEDRALSLREGATLQTFPRDYVFKSTGIEATAKLIGNAVPCEYARRLGEMIIQEHSA